MRRSKRRLGSRWRGPHFFGQCRASVVDPVVDESPIHAGGEDVLCCGSCPGTEPVSDDAVGFSQGVRGDLALPCFGVGIGFIEIADDADVFVVEGGRGCSVVETTGDDEAFVGTIGL